MSWHKALDPSDGASFFNDNRKRCSAWNSFKETDTKGLGASGNISRGFVVEIKVAARIKIGNPFMTLITPLRDGSSGLPGSF